MAETANAHVNDSANSGANASANVAAHSSAAATFRLIVATPERYFFTGDASSLTITTQDGEIGVLPGHMPMVVAIRNAPVRFLAGGEWREAALSSGFAEITGNRVVILADTAEWPEEIELNRALEAKRRAEERLRAHRSDAEYMRSQVALQRALTRINVSKLKKP
ncbi:MAG: ATP synthase F1 subunit epsilon [Clostridiales bacterium]|jgi:F-type H+-transporting ATPase subunit epsilon|nr:ATP synthase F1 subunit epsilon [Clostridiales bacterium]